MRANLQQNTTRNQQILCRFEPTCEMLRKVVQHLRQRRDFSVRVCLVEKIPTKRDATQYCLLVSVVCMDAHMTQDLPVLVPKPTMKAMAKHHSFLGSTRETEGIRRESETSNAPQKTRQAEWKTTSSLYSLGRMPPMMVLAQSIKMRGKDRSSQREGEQLNTQQINCNVKFEKKIPYLLPFAHVGVISSVAFPLLMLMRDVI